MARLNHLSAPLKDGLCRSSVSPSPLGRKRGMEPLAVTCYYFLLADMCCIKAKILQGILLLRLDSSGFEKGSSSEVQSIRNLPGFDTCHAASPLFDLSTDYQGNPTWVDFEKCVQGADLSMLVPHSLASLPLSLTWKRNYRYPSALYQAAVRRRPSSRETVGL